MELRREAQYYLRRFPTQYSVVVVCGNPPVVSRWLGALIVGKVLHVESDPTNYLQLLFAG